MGTIFFVSDRRCRQDGPAAFTLVELIVAMAVALIIVTVLLQLFSASADSWQRGETQLDAYREARGAMQLMARDLATVIRPPTKDPLGVQQKAQALAPSLVLNHYPTAADDSSVHDEDKINEELYCLTAIPNQPVKNAAQAGGTAPAASALCAVGYFCQWDDKRGAYVLYRQFLDSDKTYKCFQSAVKANGSDAPLKFLNLYTRSGVKADPNSPDAGATETASKTDLASYIWDLQFRIDTSLAAPSRSASAQPPKYVYDQSMSYQGDPPYPPLLPAFVEIRFKALSAGAVEKLKAAGGADRLAWSNPQGDAARGRVYRTLILPGTQQFVSRVPLFNGVALRPTPTPTPP